MTPRSFEECVAAAKAAFMEGQYFVAADLFKSALQVRQQPDVARDLAVSLCLSSRFDEAEAWHRQAMVLAGKPSTAPAGEFTTCPLCGAHEGDKVWVGNISELHLEVSGILDPIKVWVCCRHCGLVYMNPRPGKTALKRYYEAYYADDKKGLQAQTGSDLAFSKMLYHYRQIEVLEELRGEPQGRLLDVGAGPGFMLGVARHCGWQAKGLEVAAEVAAFSRDTFGCPVIETDLEQHQFTTDDVYDAVVMLEVIEHLYSPTGVIDTLAKLLAPKGVLLISTPDLEHPYHQLSGVSDPMWATPGHLTYLSRSTLTRMLDRAGLDLVKVRSSPVYVGSTEVYAQRRA